MKYSRTISGTFISRPNRFIAHVEIDGKVHICHVKNTGRCRELLVEGVRVILEESDNPDRKTKYDLVAVYKGDMLINIDSQAPNKVVGEWLKEGHLGEVTLIKPECVFGNSRFDFYFEADGKRAFAEVKGVTLEENGVVMFPDAPTERGVKHLAELERAVQAGYEAYAIFVIQMEKCTCFTPNKKTHPEFAKALKSASSNGVKILAYSCSVTEDSLSVYRPVDIIL